MSEMIWFIVYDMPTVNLLSLLDHLTQWVMWVIAITWCLLSVIYLIVNIYLKIFSFETIVPFQTKLCWNGPNDIYPALTSKLRFQLLLKIEIKSLNQLKIFFI